MRNNNVVVIILLSMFFTGCASITQSQRENDFYNAISAQNASDARRVNQYFARMNPPLPKAIEVAKEIQPTKITIAQAVDKFVPNDFKVFIEPDVNTKSTINYNQSLPWIDAFGEALTDIGIEANANLYKKTIKLSTLKTSLSEFLAVHVPSNFFIYQDSRINDAVSVKYDKSLYWLEALSKIGVDLGIEVNTNLTAKTIHLKPTGAQ